ncbi:MAG: amidohydrolase family protein [Deltaproteobacteria bacterium]|nr:amidohydrolase family protein [Deltaproteobacteria bacterium]
MPNQKTPIAIQGGRLIDGNGGRAVDNATVLIEGNRIRRVAAGKIEFPRETRVIDAAGKTILPGLIDNHVHYRDFYGELFLAHGVTTVRDLGNPLDWILAQRDAVNLGKVVGPRIFCTGGGIYGRGWLAHHVVPANAEEAKKAVQRFIEQGVDYAKIHLGVPVEIARSAAEEAHRAGLKLSGHLESSIIPYAEAGVDGVEHATGCADATIRSEEAKKNFASIKLFLAKFLAPWSYAEEKYFPEVVEFLARKGTFIEPTLVLWGAALGMRDQWEKEDYELVKDPNLSYIPENERLIWLEHYYLAYGPRSGKEPEPDITIGTRYSIFGIHLGDELVEGRRRFEKFLSMLAQAGGNIVAGTDASGVVPGISLHRELEMLVKAGLTPMRAIQAATRVGAEYLGKLQDLGTVEEGKLADVIVVEGDPLADIRNTRRIASVIKDGAIVDRSYHASLSNPIPRPYTQGFYGYPLPKLDSVMPAAAFEGEGEKRLVLKGKDFFPTSVARLDGRPILTEFASQQELRATIPAHLMRPGVLRITVMNPRPWEIPDLGGASNALAFIVRFNG